MRRPSTEGRAGLLPLALAGAVLAAAGGCRTVPERPRAPDLILAVAAQSVPGVRLGTIQTYAGERLYDFMDGAAVTYMEHNFHVLAAADTYRGADLAKIELYEMATAGDCERLYSQFAAAPGAPFAAGEAGCSWAGFEPEVLFRRGPYLVRLLGYCEDRDAAARLLRDLAAAIDAHLPRARPAQDRPTHPSPAN